MRALYAGKLMSQEGFFNVSCAKRKTMHEGLAGLYEPLLHMQGFTSHC